jgi:hypothetical protein
MNKSVAVLTCFASSLSGCPFARQVWHDILSWLCMTCTQLTADDTLRLVGRGEAENTQTAAQGTWVHDTAHPLDDLEAQECVSSSVCCLRRVT